MKYSLVIACKNEEKTIKELILRSKRYVDEIIVINDASKDKTKKILENLDVILINNENCLGQEKSIEKGIDIASGDIIITIDADLEHSPEDIPKFKEALKGFDLVIGRRKKLPRQGEIEMGKILSKFGVSDPLNGFKIFSKDLVKKIGFFCKNNYYGLDFVLESIKKFRVKEIEITENKRRHETRHGDPIELERKIKRIIEYLKEQLIDSKEILF